jgi:hypothetical protein
VTGEEAAVKMQKERGHVVIGCPPQDTFPKIGSRITTFAGALLFDHILLVIGETDRQDWESQVAAIFGPKHRNNKKHPPRPGQRFFSCTLEDDES